MRSAISSFRLAMMSPIRRRTSPRAGAAVPRQDIAARGRRPRTPHLESAPRRLDRTFDVRSTRQRKATDHIRDVRRIRIIEVFPTNRRNPLSADEVLEGFHFVEVRFEA